AGRCADADGHRGCGSMFEGSVRDGCSADAGGVEEAEGDRAGPDGGVSGEWLRGASRQRARGARGAQRREFVCVRRGLKQRLDEVAVFEEVLGATTVVGDGGGG